MNELSYMVCKIYTTGRVSIDGYYRDSADAEEVAQAVLKEEAGVIGALVLKAVKRYGQWGMGRVAEYERAVKS